MALPTSTSSLSTIAMNTALQLAVRTLQNILTGLLDTTGLYVLVVPIPRRGLLALSPTPNPGEMGTNILGWPVNDIISRLPAGQASAFRESPTFNQIFNPQGLQFGGNAYYVKTVAEAMYDPQDTNKPKFIRDSYWTYTLLIAGATDLASVMTAATYFDRLFVQRDANAVPATRGTGVVVAQRVSAQPSPRDQRVILTWDLVPSQIVPPEDQQYILVPVSYAIIRSTDFRAQTAHIITDLFSTNQIAVGMEGQFGSKVLDVKEYDAVTARWMDNSTLIPNTEYIYHVSFRAEMRSYRTPNEPGFLLPFHFLSNATSIRLNQRTRLPRGRGKPPDWIRTPSVASLIPAFERIVDYIQLQISRLGESAQSLTNTQTRYLRMLDNELSRYTTKADTFLRYINTLNNMMANPAAGIHVKAGIGQGDDGQFLSTLMDAFSDFEDENRPEFDTGDEYVTGVVLLAVGPDLSSVQRVYDLLAALFGSREDDPVVAGIESITTTLATVEQEALADLQSTIATPAYAFDAQLQPAAQGARCVATPETAPALGENLEPVS